MSGQHLIKMKSCFVITGQCCVSGLLLHFCHNHHHISDILEVLQHSLYWRPLQHCSTKCLVCLIEMLITMLQLNGFFHVFTFFLSVAFSLAFRFCSIVNLFFDFFLLYLFLFGSVQLSQQSIK